MLLMKIHLLIRIYFWLLSLSKTYPILSGTELSFLENFSCAAQSSPDVLHFGSMLHDPDQSHFETDMQREFQIFFVLELLKLLFDFVFLLV